MSRAAEWLGLAAAPTFATMALLSATTDAPAEMLCLPGGSSAFTGMTAMYLLMAAFHATPWLRRLETMMNDQRGGR